VRPESNFWSKLKRKIAREYVFGKWQRVEVKLPLGFPDCVVLLPYNRRVMFVELKAVEYEHELKHELRAEQAVWIDRWNDDGGEAYILAHIKSLHRMQWYIEGKAMRQGIFHQVPAPMGVYAGTYDGRI
jgi:hypothetical protein